MAVEYDEGVIIGADSRTTTGYVSYFKNSSLQLNSLPISYCISYIHGGNFGSSFLGNSGNLQEF